MQGNNPPGNVPPGNIIQRLDPRTKLALFITLHLWGWDRIPGLRL